MKLILASSRPCRVFHFMSRYQYFQQIILLFYSMQSDSNDYEPLHLDVRAYRYFPTLQEQKIGFNTPKGNRILFYGQIEHDDNEKKKLKQFEEFLKVKTGNTYDQAYFTPHKLLLFLSGNQYKNEQTYEAMIKHMEFRQKYVLNSEGIRIIKYETDQKVKSLIDAGFFYVCGRDKLFRPAIVFNLPKVDLSDTDAVLRAVIFVQEEVIEKMFIPGQVECWNIIYDIGGMGITDVPVNALKPTLKTISSNYGGRLYRLWMLNCPGTIYFSWKVVKTFLDPVTVDKIVIVKKNTDESLWKTFDPSQIEKKYGGTQPDREKFYPFRIPPLKFDESRLVSEEKYKQMIDSGFLKNNVIEPKFAEKM